MELTEATYLPTNRLKVTYIYVLYKFPILGHSWKL